jgi:hypothetical protein
MRVLPLVSLALLFAACGDEAGVEGTNILEEYAGLSGGVVFATAAIIDSNDYDLYWAPAPQVATIEQQPLYRLTEADGNEYQPSVSRGGKGIVFARAEDGIFLINTSGRISRVSSTKDIDMLRDSLPSISFDGTKVAWVREDLSKPIGETGFFETQVMVADFDGADTRPVLPRPGFVQDAPVWEPRDGSEKLAWSEFDATSLSGAGPSRFGIYMMELATNTGRYVCQSPETQIDNSLGPRGYGYRCFGQHLAWPFQDFIITAQDLIEINLITGDLTTVWPQIIVGLQGQGMNSPNIAASPSGFFPAFPVSVSYANNRLILDGVIEPSDGDETTLAFFLADLDGGGIWRLQIDGLRRDLDLGRTNSFFFSLATPQLVP